MKSKSANEKQETRTIETRSKRTRQQNNEGKPNNSVVETYINDFFDESDTELPVKKKKKARKKKVETNKTAKDTKYDTDESYNTDVSCDIDERNSSGESETELPVKVAKNKRSKKGNASKTKKQSNPSESSQIRPFVCTFKDCNKNFAFKRGLGDHMRIHKKPLKCTECDKYFRSQYDFKLHFSAVHDPQRKLHQCHFCKAAFKVKKYLSNHIELHEKLNKKIRRRMWKLRVEKKFKCKLCSKQFNNFFSLKIHRRRHRGQKIYECSECNNKFITKIACAIHSKIHNDPTQLNETEMEKDIPTHCLNICYEENCLRTFATRHGLQYHLRVHKNEKPFKCSGCKQTFRGVKDRNRHYNSFHNKNRPIYKCPKCYVLLLERKSIRRHLSMHNLNYSADVSLEQFIVKPDIDENTGDQEMHQSEPENEIQKKQTATDIVDGDSDKETDKSTTTHGIICTWNNCFIRFKSFEELQRHLRSHSNENRFKCSTCDEIFQYKVDLDKHFEMCHPHRATDNIRDDTLTELNKNAVSNENENSGNEIDKVNSKRNENVRSEQITLSRTSNTSDSNSNKNCDDDHHSTNKTVTARVENVDIENSILLNMLKGNIKQRGDKGTVRGITNASKFNSKNVNATKSVSSNHSDNSSLDSWRPNDDNESRTKRRQTHGENYLEESFDETDTEANVSSGCKASNKKEESKNSYTCDWKNCGISFLEYSDLLLHKKIHLACRTKKSRTKIKQGKPNAETVKSNNSEPQINPHNNSLQSLENNGAGSEIAISPKDTMEQQIQNVNSKAQKTNNTIVLNINKNYDKQEIKIETISDESEDDDIDEWLQLIKKMIEQKVKKEKDVTQETSISIGTVSNKIYGHLSALLGAIQSNENDNSQLDLKRETDSIKKESEDVDDILQMLKNKMKQLIEKEKRVTPTPQILLERNSSNIVRNFPLENLEARVETTPHSKSKTKVSSTVLVCSWGNCNNSFTKIDRYKYHMLVHEGKKPLKCSFCDKCFLAKTMLIQHLKLKHSHQISNKSKQRDLNKHKKQYKCKRCDKTYQLKFYFKLHLRNHKKNKTLYECTKCQIKFRYIQDYQKHIKTRITLEASLEANLEANLECEQCHRIFTQDTHLDSHRVVCLKKEQFECAECHRKFPVKRWLAQHMRIHRTQGNFYFHKTN